MSQETQTGTLYQPSVVEWGERWEGGRFKWEGIYVYLWLIHVEVWQKTAKLCKSIILQLQNKRTKKISTNNKHWREHGEKGTLLLSQWECKLVQSLWRTVWRFLKKLKVVLPYDPAIPLLGIYPEQNNMKGYMHSNVHCSTVYNSQDMETT